MLFIIIGLVLIVGGAGFYFYSQNKTTAIPAGTELTEEVDTETNTAAKGTYSTDTESADDTSGESSAATETAAIDVDAAMAPRTLGNADAPVTIREYASLTCGHCGDFHKNTFDQIKAEYIDTGKVYFIFNDFPLNGPAVHASMVARCLDESRYFNFIGLLFKNQEDWAYDRNYITYLRQNAALAGLGNNEFDACINNTELKEQLSSKMREEQQKYSINSTPTFVINEDNVTSGARDFAAYKIMIDEALSSAE